MKIGIITDVHVRGKSPINRIDDFYVSIMEKFTEALKIFKKKKCDIILDAGDLLHSPIISLTICDDIIDLIDNNKIHYYTVFGNHPMLNAHIENSKATTLAHMFRRSEYLKYLEHLKVDNKNDKHKINIKGMEYSHGIEDIIKNGGIHHNKKFDTVTIAVVHAMITEKKMMDKILHIPYKDLKTNYDYVIVGHNHHEIGIQKVGDTTIIGLGALARLTMDKKDYTRKPKVAVLDTETGEVEVIKLKTAKPYKEVFNLELMEKKKKADANLEVFAQTLEDTKLQSIDTIGLIMEIAKKKEIDKNIINAIITKMESFDE